MFFWKILKTLLIVHFVTEVSLLYIFEIYVKCCVF
jgi:hypothetical protein